MQHLSSHGLWDTKDLCNFSRNLMCLWSLVALESDVLSSLGSHLHNLLCSLQIRTKNLTLFSRTFNQKPDSNTLLTEGLQFGPLPLKNPMQWATLFSPGPCLGSCSSLSLLIQSRSFSYTGCFNSSLLLLCPRLTFTGARDSISR